MSLKFPDELIIGGNGEWTYKPFRFNIHAINVGKSEPSWKDVILSGVSPLTLINAKADGLNYLKLFGGTEQRNLPEGFTQVEYLESSGTQYIDTGVYANTTTSMFHCGLTPTQTDTSVGVFGSRQNTSANSSSCNVFILDNTFRLDWTNSASQLTVPITTNTYYDIKCSRPTCTINGVQYTSTKTDSVTQTHPFYIGSFANAGNEPFSRGFIGYIHFGKLYNNGSLVFNGIPCRRNSDNVLGMYDTVSGNFFTNAGTGTFTAGSDVVPSPDTPMDIVCNNGVVKVSKNLFDKNTAQNVEGAISDAGVISYNTNAGTFEMKVSPNTQYTLSIGSDLGTTIFRITGLQNKWDGSSSVSGNLIVFLSTPTKYTFITSSETNYIYFQTNIAKFDNVKNTLQLEQGSTATPYMPYGQIYTDGTTEKVEVHSKNLFNPATVTTGKMINSDGTITDNVNLGISDYINISNASYITINILSVNVNNGSVCFYDKNKTYISGSAFSRQVTKTISVPENAVYIITTFVPSEINGTQVELGTTATTYEPYYYGGSATAEMLLGVGDYQDEFILEN